MAVLGLYGGSRRSVQARSGSGSVGAAAPVKQLLRRLWYRLRRSVAWPRRAVPVSFGYDLHSYSQNFDDGVGSGHAIALRYGLAGASYLPREFCQCY